MLANIADNSERLPLCALINDREKPWALNARPIDYKLCCIDRLNSQTKADNLPSNFSANAAAVFGLAKYHRK